MAEYATVLRQRDELRIRIQHLLHLLNDSQTAYDAQAKENEVLRHALSQGMNAVSDNVAPAVPGEPIITQVCTRHNSYKVK